MHQIGEHCNIGQRYNYFVWATELIAKDANSFGKSSIKKA